MIETAAINRGPQILVHYLRDTAAAFHAFYNAQPILGAEVNLTDDTLAWALRSDTTWSHVHGPEGIDTHRRLEELALLERKA